MIGVMSRVAWEDQKKKKSIKQALKSKRIGESSTDSNAKMALESSLERSLGGMGGGQDIPFRQKQHVKRHRCLV